ncbi:hypothetical protein LOTGIDRAFT_159901 [Lottia gigantea]|uniref:Uncharacterized protein n=1 Tax=Lottia gigantea TaxID=225164 RepID=V4ANX2_LOTGI|nr:hypothetical protein LOTGIDRAFT_159901 [Lottia gigantea]ESO96485.1 hypothetical protein LOTGIDRAFT_159901 [Lottia gigantea]
MDFRSGMILLCTLTIVFSTVAQNIGIKRHMGIVGRSEILDRQQPAERLKEEHFENDRHAALTDEEDLKRLQVQIVRQVKSIKMFAQGLVNLMDSRIDAWNRTIIKLRTATRLVINTTQATATNETYIAAMFKMNWEDVLMRKESEDVGDVPEELYQHQLAVEVDVIRQLAIRALDGTTRRIANRRNAMNAVDERN